MKKILLFCLLTPFISFSQKIEIYGKSNITESEIRDIISVYSNDLLKKVSYIKVVEALEHKNVLGKASYNHIIIVGSVPKRYIVKTIHHELSSTFLQSYDVFRTHKILEAEFKALNGSINYTGEDAPIRDLTESEKKIFALSSYAKTTFENDYNTICEELFTNPNFIDSLDKNSVLYRKTMLVIDFYNKLDKKFTFEFFQNITL